MTDIIDIKYPHFNDNHEDNREERPQTASLSLEQNEPAKEQRKTLELSEISDIASRLGRVLAEETYLLSIMDVKAVAKLQDEKGKLISALELQKKILKMDPSIKKGFSKEEIKEFENIGHMFDSVLAENYRQLLRVKLVNQRVISMIAKAVIEKTPTAAGYGKNGMVAQQSLQDMPLALRQNI